MDERETAIAEFKRSIRIILIVAVLMVIVALVGLRLFGALNAVTVLATSLGVFLSVLLGCGLFAAAFFSEKSGLDQQVTDVTRTERVRARRPKRLPKSAPRNLP